MYNKSLKIIFFVESKFNIIIYNNFFFYVICFNFIDISIFLSISFISDSFILMPNKLENKIVKFFYKHKTTLSSIVINPYFSFVIFFIINDFISNPLRSLIKKSFPKSIKINPLNKRI